MAWPAGVIDTSEPLTPIPGETRGEAGGIVSCCIDTTLTATPGRAGRPNPEGWGSESSLLPPDGGLSHPRGGAESSASAPGVAVLSAERGNEERRMQPGWLLSKGAFRYAIIFAVF